MAIIYVNSGAAGANNGTSWTDAYTSLASTTGAAAGDEIRVHKTHSQDPGASVTYNWSNGTEVAPVKIVCVDKDASDALSTGATIAQTVSGRNIVLNGSFYMDGMTINAADGLTIATVNKSSVYRNCTLGIVVTVNNRNIDCTSNGSTIDMRSCTLNVTNASGSLVRNNGSSKWTLVNCTINFHASATNGPTLSANGMFEFRSCIFGSVTNKFNLSGVSGTLKAIGCKLGTYTNLFNTTVGTGAEGFVYDSVTGTITVPTVGLIGYICDRGTILGDATRYRTGGASNPDGTTYSWSMAGSAAAEEQIRAVRSPPIARWVEGGSSITVTAYVAGGAEIYDDEFWIELEGPDDSNTGQRYYADSRLSWRGTRAALASDGSTWTGSGVGTVRKVSLTYTPDHDGLLVVRAAYAKTSGAAIYVDPFILVV